YKSGRPLTENVFAHSSANADVVIKAVSREICKAFRMASLLGCSTKSQVNMFRGKIRPRWDRLSRAFTPHIAGIAPPLTSAMASIQSKLKSMKPLTNQVALVTGGTRGIGRAITKMLLTQGTAVAICGRREEDVTR